MKEKIRNIIEVEVILHPGARKKRIDIATDKILALLEEKEERIRELEANLKQQIIDYSKLIYSEGDKVLKLRSENEKLREKLKNSISLNEIEPELNKVHEIKRSPGSTWNDSCKFFVKGYNAALEDLKKTDSE